MASDFPKYEDMTFSRVISPIKSLRLFFSSLKYGAISNKIITVSLSMLLPLKSLSPYTNSWNFLTALAVFLS